MVAANISKPVNQHSGYLGPTSHCLLSSLLFFCLSKISLCLLLMRTLEISFRIQPDKPGLSHFIYIYIYIYIAWVSHTPTSFLAQNYPTPCRDPSYREKPYLPMTLGTFRVPGLLILDLPKKYCGANPFLFRIHFIIYDLVLWVSFFFW